MIGTFTQHVIIGRVNRCLFSEFSIELADVVVTFENGLVGWIVTFSVDIGPIQMTKERMILKETWPRSSISRQMDYLDRFGIVGATTKAMADLPTKQLESDRLLFKGEIPATHTSNELSGVNGQIGGQDQFGFDNFIHRPFSVVGCEGRLNQKCEYSE